MNFYKRYLGDYARDTAHLSLMEHGAYQVLLDTYYATGALPAEKAELYRIARAMSGTERKAVAKVADEFFAINGDGSRHNKRADIELANAHAYAEKQAERAHMRWHKPPDMPDGCETHANHSHSQKDQKLLPPSGGFERFWDAWPKTDRKSAKGKCFDVWKRKGLETKADEVLAHVDAMKASAQWQTDEYVPAPLVYLNGERWDGAQIQRGSNKVAL